MPYIILVFGFLIGLYGLYRFFMVANVSQIKALFTTALFVVLCVALFFLVITGKLPAALALLGAVTPIVLAWWKHRNTPPAAAASSDSSSMTRAEALDVLGLEQDATKEEILAAYKKLVKKVHPDQEGSKWMTAKLNQARDILTKDT
ncbi:MAG: J domain-containing protein [Rhodospirillales bacterium]|nr:J domain-containing protein [Rhodospirillales bacterium]